VASATAAAERRSRPGPSPVDRALRSPGPGESLPAQVARPIGASLGMDVGSVRVHTDAGAAAAADSLSARAFAHGSRVFLGSGERPTDVGLMAHEVAHVVQQRAGPALRTFTTAGSEPFEREAQSVSSAVVAGRPVRVAGRTGGPRIQRSFWRSLVSGAKAVGGAVVSGVKAVGELAAEALNAAKKAALDYIKEHARSIPGYDLLAFILERDPITQEPVARSPMSLAKGLLGLIPGGAGMYKDLEESGALQKTVDWFLGESKKLDLSWAGIRALFATAWDQLSLGDLVPPTKAWEKIKAIFGPTVGRLVEFAKAAGKKILELMFEAVMGRGGLGAQILAFFRRVQSVFGLIVADPKKFLANLLAAFKGGVQKFADNFVEHLKKALFDWLFGALKGAITLPKKFDVAGLIDIVLQVLGLTYANVRMILVEKIGETAVGYIEKAFEFLKVLVTQGLPAAWEKLKEFATGMIDTVIEGIVSWVSKTIVGAAVIKLVSMFNPVGAFIQSIITIYDTVKFFIEKAKQLAELLNSIVDSIERIATGNIAGAVDYVERTLARVLGVVIAFLANFLHLSGITDKIKEVIKKIQDKVLGGVRKLVDWIANQVKGLLAGRKDAAAAVPEQSFDAEGVPHRLFFKEQGAHEVPMVASEPRTLADLLKDLDTPSLTPAKKEALKKARALLPTVEAAADDVGGKTTKAMPAEAKKQKLLALDTELAGYLKILLTGVDAKKFDEVYALEGLSGTYGSMPKPKSDQMEADHQPQQGLLKWIYASTYETTAGPGSRTPLFQKRGLERAIAGTRADGAWAINLQKLRHMEGRTWGSKGSSSLDAAKPSVTKINDDANASPDDKRAKVITLLRGELKADVDSIISVVNRKDDDPKGWGDIVPLGLSDKDRKPFIEKIRKRILAGEAAMKTQDLNSYSKL
jgi:hypothetical protein